jgi:hypothetical protein
MNDSDVAVNSVGRRDFCAAASNLVLAASATGSAAETPGGLA